MSIATCPYLAGLKHPLGCKYLGKPIASTSHIFKFAVAVSLRAISYYVFALFLGSLRPTASAHLFVCSHLLLFRVC